MMDRRISNENGSALLLTMLAAGVLSFFLTIVPMFLINSNHLYQRNVVSQAEVEAIEKSVNFALADEAVCKLNFAGQPWGTLLTGIDLNLGGGHKLSQLVSKSRSDIQIKNIRFSQIYPDVAELTYELAIGRPDPKTSSGKAVINVAVGEDGNIATCTTRYVKSDIAPICPPPGGGAPVFPGPIDALCDVAGSEIYFPPKTTPLPFFSACTEGFEVNNFYNRKIVITRATPLATAIDVHVDVATYLAPDSIIIDSEDQTATSTKLVQSCRMRTANTPDPTLGSSRPPESMIRDYIIKLPAGSTTFVLDLLKSPSPVYVKVQGLCGFDVAHPAVTVGAISSFENSKFKPRYQSF
jgi:hypothetical protein